MFSKLTTPMTFSAYNEQYGCQFTAAIPTNVFGEGESVDIDLYPTERFSDFCPTRNSNYDLLHAHVIPALTHRCYLAKSELKDTYFLPAFS